jgi:hypothetical protein
MKHAIMWGNGTGDQDFEEGSLAQNAADVTWNDLASTDIYAQPGEKTYENNIHLDPLFIDSVNYDYNVQPGSPCEAGGEGGAPIGARF